MADSKSFETAAELLERSTTLDRLEARGTLRIALKEAGFEARSVGAKELRVVVERILPKELTARGVDDATSVIARLMAGLGSVGDAPDDESPESVFRRLGGDT